MSEVVFEKLKKVYQEKSRNLFVAVDSIDLSIKSGEFMVLVGPSGCGKSTTLRMLAGLESSSSGCIFIGGRQVEGLHPKDRDIAMVFQNYALYPHMSVFENMAFGLKMRKTGKSEIRSRVEEAATLLGIGENLQKKPAALSGGQRQRVALGRAIVRKPKVFLFDEPLSNLDAKMRTSMRAELTRLHRQLGATMIYVTHDQVEAMTMGDRICVMNEGRIEQVGTPTEIYHSPSTLFVANFIGSPPMNIFEGRILVERGKAEFQISGDTQTLNLEGLVAPQVMQQLAGKSGELVFLGIRPEDLVLGNSTNSSELCAIVDFIEQLGADTHLHLKREESSFIVRENSSETYSIGHGVGLSFKPNRVHLFEKSSGLAIR